MIKAVISDFGGVVTLPLIEGFKRAHAELGVPIEALAAAMTLTASRNPEPPLWTLERGLGPQWTPEAASAWTAAYSTLSGFMIAEAYGSAQAAE